MGNPLKEWGPRSLDTYRDEGLIYLVTTEELFHRYLRTPKGGSFPSFKKFYLDIEARALHIREFDPHPINRPGPQVLLYRLQSQ